MEIYVVGVTEYRNGPMLVRLVENHAGFHYTCGRIHCYLGKISKVRAIEIVSAVLWDSGLTRQSL